MANKYVAKSPGCFTAPKIALKQKKKAFEQQFWAIKNKNFQPGEQFLKYII